MKTQFGSNEKDIQFHYDLCHEFYTLWLDDTMTYSSAMFVDGDSLESAQVRKLDYHIDQSSVTDGSRILDIGCGWGGLIERVHARFDGCSATGLTLSSDQQGYAIRRQSPRTEIILSPWQLYETEGTYDSITAIGVFEHAARPGLTVKEKISAYRALFKFCRAALRPGGRLSMQAIIFDQLQERQFPPFISRRIFPNAMLPRLDELISAADRILTIVSARNDPSDYGKTCRIWKSNLESAADKAISLVGEERFNEYRRYLGMSAKAFEQQGFGLCRITFESYR